MARKKKAQEVKPEIKEEAPVVEETKAEPEIKEEAPVVEETKAEPEIKEEAPVVETYCLAKGKSITHGNTIFDGDVSENDLGKEIFDKFKDSGHIVKA